MKVFLTVENVVLKDTIHGFVFQETLIQNQAVLMFAAPKTEEIQTEEMDWAEEVYVLKK